MLMDGSLATAGTAASVRPQHCAGRECMASQPPTQRRPRRRCRRPVSAVAAGGTAAGISVPRHWAGGGAARIRRAAAGGVRPVVRGAPAWLLWSRRPADAGRDAPRCSPTAGCTPASSLCERSLSILACASSLLLRQMPHGCMIGCLVPNSTHAVCCIDCF